MKVAVVYGTEHRGSTYNIVQLFLDGLHVPEGDLSEFFLPRDMPHFCCGCVRCIEKGEEYCPHREAIASIETAMEKADLIVLASPVYVLRVTGQMKAFLDHFAFRFMVHRPNEAMFSKTALVVTTAAGSGMKSAIRDMTASLTHWGVGRIFTYGRAVAATDWHGVKDGKKRQIERDVERLSARIRKGYRDVTPNLKVKALFHAMRLLHKNLAFNRIDLEYWEQRGWLRQGRPWKR